MRDLQLVGDGVGSEEEGADNFFAVERRGAAGESSQHDTDTAQ